MLTFDFEIWLNHFEHHARHPRCVPSGLPDRLRPDERGCIAASIATFQLGERSEGCTLLRAARRFADEHGTPELARIIELFIRGYARAVRVGPHVFVSGITAREPHLEGDAHVQLRAAIATVTTALSAAGAELRHVVRTVVYTVNMADAAHIARAHREAFGDSRPASTLVQVAAVTPASARVEIEVTAFVHD